MLFAPEYEAVVGFTVSAFNSPHYEAFDPRHAVIMNLISMQLIKDNENN